ncbi:FtsK/SpoIIIE domain-containing protein [Streptomyces sp. NBC_00233]|uniref:FtsK/SpoIIIE domain-containing protein n=1 Tax=Streptomyces sp. NBC_00233 TaxID=2975686 RepID=UPI0022515AF6|nr:FtsK/SpoIIIE domain-containing protein [Streptomyces sp. NBC_00233]MCX5226281.1 FtsK/SpoIIIE domain-containing protein [Streptomyces sp. NBC_00233]
MTENHVEPHTPSTPAPVEPTIATVTFLRPAIPAPAPVVEEDVWSDMPDDSDPTPVVPPMPSVAPTVGPDDRTIVLDTARVILAKTSTPAPVSGKVEKVDLDDFGDRPLIPAWMYSAEGWAAWAGVFARARRRDFRRWVRRQTTQKGHVRQFGRGVRRSHEWVVGFEGVRVRSAAHTAHVLTREARLAARHARFTPRIMGTKRELAMKAAERATKAAEEAVLLHKKAKKDRNRARNLRAGVAYGPPLTAIGTGYAMGGGLGLAAGLLSTFAGGAFVGRTPYDEDADWTSEWRSLGDGDRMTAPMLDQSFRAAKVIGSEESLRVVQMPMLDTRGAWTTILDLPPGIPAKRAIRATDELAAAFGVEEAQVSIAKRGRSGRIELYVSRDLPFTDKAKPGPLLALEAAANFWGPISIGPDVRGLPISMSVVERSGLIGGEPGAGKSASGNTVLLAAALDPRVILVLADGKGGGDLEPFEHLCESFEGDADPEAFYEMLKERVEDMKQRYALLKKLGKRKVTEELAAKYSELRQLLLWVDELMFYTTDEEYGKKITKLLRNLVSRGRAAGIITFCATQKPGSDVVDTSLRDLLSIRWALRCTTPEASDTILGKGAAASGYSAKTIQSEMRGAGLLWAEGTNPTMVRADYYTDEQVEQLLARATEWRRKAGTLPNGPVPLVDQLRAQGDDDALLLAAVLDTFAVHATEDGPAEWLPGQLLLDDLKAAGYPVTAEKLGALIVRTDEEKAKRPWGEKGSRVTGYPLARVEAAATGRFGLTA